MTFIVYIYCLCVHNRYYIGQTNGLSERIIRHNKGFVTSTRHYTPWEVVGYVEKPTRKEAVMLERKLKNLNTEDLKTFYKKYFGK